MSQSTGPSVRVRRAQNPLLEIRTNERAEQSPSLWPLLYVLVLPTSGEFMRRLPQLKNLIIIRRRRARGIIPWPFRHHFLLKRRLASRRTGETFRLRRVRGTRRQKWFARGETPDNLCQLWEHKLFPRFQVGPSASVCRVGSIWAFVVETTDFSRPEEQWSQRGEGRTNNLTCRR